MDFRDYAATETSALLGRLLSTQAEGAVQQLRALREALDAAARAVEASAGVPRAAEKEIGTLAAKLGAAALAELQRVQQDANAGLETARADLKTHLAENKKLAAALAEARAQEEKLRDAVQREAERADTADRDLDATIEAHKQVDAARMEAEAAQKKEAHARAALEIDLRDLRGLLESTRAEASRLSDQLESEGAQNAILAAEREAAAAECVALTAQLAAATQQFQGVTVQFQAASLQHRNAVAQLEALTAERDDSRAHAQALESDQAEKDDRIRQLESEQAAREERIRQFESEQAEKDEQVRQLEREQAAKDDQLRALEARLADSLGAEAGLRDDAAGSVAELERARAELEAVNGHAARLASLLDGSVRAMDELGSATNIAELLASLVRQLATAFPRVALFRVKGNHVEGEHQLGFDMTADVSKLMIPLNVDSLITRAAASGVAAQLTGADLAGTNRSPFGETPATAIALPIGFQDETLAVAYLESDHAASDEGLAAHEAIAGFATLLVRHTAVLVTRLSQELKMLAELREYATMLLQEADQMFAADVEAGKTEAERRRRLQETIDCARQLYAQRAALEGAAAATLLDEQIALQASGGTPFAHELAAVAGHDVQQQQSRRTAS